MHQTLRADRAALGDTLAAVLHHAHHFYATLPERSAGVTEPAQPLPPVALPETGAGAAAAFAEATARFDGMIAATTSPRYLGFVTGGTTPAALAGDWLAAVYDQNPQGCERWFGDVSGRIEYETIGLLRDLLGLPEAFNGGLVTGATMANLTCLGVARQWVGRAQGYDVARAGLRKPVAVLTAVPHSSAIKSLALLGLGAEAVVPVKTLPGREAMDVADLELRAAELAGQPFIVIASGGTVNTVDYDDFGAILQLRKRFTFWLHIDAAFGGFAGLLSPEFRARTQVPGRLLEQWEGADSITVDNHKWLNVPYDSGVWFVRREHQADQQATFGNGSAAYLDAQADFNYLNLGPENSRRLRALPVWLTLRAYGRTGYRDIVERSVATAFAFGRALEADSAFELIAPVRLNVVAFTLTDRLAADVDHLLQRLNDRGRYFCTPTTLFGRRGIRAAFVNWQHETDQAKALLTELTAALSELPNNA